MPGLKGAIQGRGKKCTVKNPEQNHGLKSVSKKQFKLKLEKIYEWERFMRGIKDRKTT